MKSRAVVYLFISTLLIGSLSSAVVGTILRWNDVEGIGSLLATIVWLFGYGAIWSLISQMGFFAYLTIHRFGLGLTKSVSLWNKIQIVLIVFILFDLFYFRYNGEDLLFHLLIPIGLFLYSWLVAYKKSVETNKGAFIPALFFMTVVTTLEWIPALRSDDVNFLWLSFAPLIVSNTWQILTLHKLHEKPAQS